MNAHVNPTGSTPQPQPHGAGYGRRVDITWLSIVVALVGIVLIAIASRSSTTKNLERKLDRLERKLDLVMRQLGVEQPTAAADDDVVALVRAGHRIEAIKRYRELTGAGLKEAKDAVDQIV